MENSKIEWTTHTWNPWTGCVKVSPGCDHCYAERIATRFGRGEWTKDGLRSFPADEKWVEPLRWNDRAAAKKVRERVFCGSMCDVMEDRRDLDAARLQLFITIERTPSLDWLLLTKRPQNFKRLLPQAWLETPRRNVWLLTTIESPDQYWRWFELEKIRAAVRGISYEPALAPISLDEFATFHEYDDWEGDPAVPMGTRHFRVRVMTKGPDWIIAGSESGPAARPAEWQWFESLQRECEEYGVAYFFKQYIRDRSEKISLPVLNGRQFAEVPRAA